jgi:hypothetical protein
MIGGNRGMFSESAFSSLLILTCGSCGYSVFYCKCSLSIDSEIFLIYFLTSSEILCEGKAIGERIFLLTSSENVCKPRRNPLTYFIGLYYFLRYFFFEKLGLYFLWYKVHRETETKKRTKTDKKQTINPFKVADDDSQANPL